MARTEDDRPCRSEHGALLVETAAARLPLPYDAPRQRPG